MNQEENSKITNAIDIYNEENQIKKINEELSKLLSIKNEKNMSNNKTSIRSRVTHDFFATNGDH